MESFGNCQCCDVTLFEKGKAQIRGQCVVMLFIFDDATYRSSTTRNE